MASAYLSQALYPVGDVVAAASTPAAPRCIRDSACPGPPRLKFLGRELGKCAELSA